MVSTSTISRTVRICRWQAHVNSLWLWAYCILTMSLHGYLMYRAVSRCKDYNELPWRTHDKPVIELYVYIALIVLSVMCVPFFVITSVFKVGNYAGDGVRFGRDNIHEQELAEAAAMATIPTSSVAGNHGDDVTDDVVHTETPSEVTSQRTVGSKLQRLWRHVGPFSHGFHVISAFSLLLPSMLLEAQEIKYGFRNPESSWQSDLDWMFGWHVPDTYQVKHDPNNMILEYTSVDSTSLNPLGGALQSLEDAARQTAPSSDVQTQKSDVISPEFINYILALAFYCVRYAAVFWYTKMSFSIVFLIQLFIVIIHFSFAFCGTAILYKFQVNNVMFSDLGLALPSVATLSLYLAANFFLLLSTIAVFNYGHQHYNDRWQKFLQSYAPMYCRQRKGRRGYHSYAPHTMASVILLLVILCRGGIVYDYVIVYRKTGFPIILACIVVDALLMISWIALWFGLTLKQKWDFQIMFARYVMPTPLRSTPVNGHGSSRRTRSTGERTSSPDEQMTSAYEEPRAVTSVSEHLPQSPNGKVLNIDVDTADGLAADLQGPGGVLRKSNTRRSASTQRVKFDASADAKLPKDKTTGNQNMDGNGSSNNNVKSDEPNGNLRRAYSDSTSRGRSRRKDSSDEYVTDSTPENTLTRTYRHSIRDTCGLYFRISRDMSPSPAAHSSPRPADKRMDRTPMPSPVKAGHPTRKEEVLLNPLKADKLFPTNQPDSGDPSGSDATMSNSYSPGEGSTLAMPLSYSPNDSGVQLRRSHQDRGRHDDRYSYPMASSPPQGWSYGEQERSPRGQVPPYIGRDALPARHSLHLDRPRVHEGSFLSNNISRPHRKSREPIPWSPDGPIRPERDTARTDRAKTPPLPPRPPRHHSQDYSRGYKNSRDLRIVPKKAELSNRDSALPSSNETSSNDSNDVLCSQV